MSPYGSYVFETVLTLGGVSALAFVLLYGARRIGMGRGTMTEGLELVGRLAIDTRRSVVLVRVGGQVFVVGVSEGGLMKLGEMAASELPPRRVVTGTAFADVLSGALGRGRTREESKDT